jgi:hypothetical protein
MPSTKNDAVSFSFNRKVFTFNKVSLRKAIEKGIKTAPPRDASGLLHQIKLPGVKTPVSVNWVALHLLDTPAIGESKNGLPKGAYHPAQILSVARHLAPLGVGLKVTAESPRYAAFWDDKQKAAYAKAQKANAPKAKNTRKTATVKAKAK